MRKTNKQTINVLKALQSRPQNKRGGSEKLEDGLDRSNPKNMAVLCKSFIEYLGIKNYSQSTLNSRTNNLLQFFNWCEQRDLKKPEQIDRRILESYQRWLYRFRQNNGKPLGVITQQQRLASIKSFFKWLCRQNYILHNPASELEMPRSEKKLPQAALTSNEVEKVLKLADTSDPLGLRDRAIMETLYSTAIRRSELCRLQIDDLSFERKNLWVRQGKGKKDRVVPIGSRALDWINQYLLQARPKLEIAVSEKTLFLSAYGIGITPDHLSGVIKKYIDDAQIGKKGSCHLFRHTCATLMLENGADIRYIQQLLGHANLETTSIYTEVTIKALQSIHELTHPAKA